MRKLALTALSLLAVPLLIATSPIKVHAGGAGGPNLELTSNATSATVGGATIGFSIYAYDYYCPSDASPQSHFSDATIPCIDGSHAIVKSSYPNMPVTIKVSGTGNTISPAPYNTDAGGNAHFTLASSVAEPKTVQACINSVADGICYTDGAVISVSFGAPVAAPAVAPSAKTASPAAVAPTTPTPVVTAAAPAAPATDTLKISVAGQPVDNSKRITLNTDQPLVLSGKTIPNGIVNLTIHSTPRTATVTADASGNWTYTVTGLESGDHHAYATVTDPVTKQTSVQATLLAFSVAAVKPTTVAVVTPVAAHKASMMVWYVGAAVLLVLAGVGVWFFTRKRQTYKV